MVVQHFLMNMPLKPFGPGALTVGINLMTTSISSFVKGCIKDYRSCDSISCSKLKCMTGFEVTPILFLNVVHMIVVLDS